MGEKGIKRGRIHMRLNRRDRAALLQAANTLEEQMQQVAREPVENRIAEYANTDSANSFLLDLF
jgi:hypothetical protein